MGDEQRHFLASPRVRLQYSRRLLEGHVPEANAAKKLLDEKLNLLMNNVPFRPGADFSVPG